METRRDGDRAAHAPFVLGLAGGIGAGKSRVAREFEALGAVVLDSDAEARAALERPEARATLVEWWGEGVLGADGRVDRNRIASIVFAETGGETERKRLEGLVHPLVKRTRAAAVAEAALKGASLVVIDAPLLFEAGVDGECDAVVFVDAPRELRLARVRASRGWDEAELAKREAQQWPLDEKRRRSRFIVRNDGDERALAAEVARVYGEVAG